ncbi:hypothetical protein VIGAN_06142200 [Vigna angularis var. angularis]|uniref:Uncharacterized protein n=1 Tax=Vigna angularis var. angularis TaxID=157739 RepID=A0A0S3SBN5_PHAAN|nr:hypothetical protein VIGAN_06142200 [Vigna angularis var. angularis]
MGFDGRSSEESLTFEPTMTWKGKGSSLEAEEFLPDGDTLKESSYSFEDGGPSLFAGASHPPKPVDTDLMRTVYVPIGQNKSEAGCLIKSLPTKGHFFGRSLNSCFCKETKSSCSYP